MSQIADLKNLSILYADDDEILRESTSKILNMLFDKVYETKDGEDAIKTIEKIGKIDIIMLDIKMKSISGIDVAKYIRQKDKKVPIFLVSSYTETNDLIEACKLNLVDYIKKPFSFKTLSQTLLECLEKIKSEKIIFKRISNTIKYNPSSKEIIINDINYSLTNNEILILEFLIEKKGQVVSYETCMSILGDDISDAALKNTILRLRKKIGEKYIKNLSKVGYTLICD